MCLCVFQAQDWFEGAGVSEASERCRPRGQVPLPATVPSFLPQEPSLPCSRASQVLDLPAVVDGHIDNVALKLFQAGLLRVLETPGIISPDFQGLESP